MNLRHFTPISASHNIPAQLPQTNVKPPHLRNKDNVNSPSEAFTHNIKRPTLSRRSPSPNRNLKSTRGPTPSHSPNPNPGPGPRPIPNTDANSNSNSNYKPVPTLTPGANPSPDIKMQMNIDSKSKSNSRREANSNQAAAGRSTTSNKSYMVLSAHSKPYFTNGLQGECDAFSHVRQRPEERSQLIDNHFSKVAVNNARYQDQLWLEFSLHIRRITYPV